MRGALIALTASCLAACMADPGWARRVGSIEATLAAAESAGAMRCAPRELALGRAHLAFAVLERERGHRSRADEHLAVAEPNADAAVYLSPAQRCSDHPIQEPTDDAPASSGALDDPPAGGSDGSSPPPSGEPQSEEGAPDPLPQQAQQGAGTSEVAPEDGLGGEGAPGTLDGPPGPSVPAPLPDQDLDGVPDASDECPAVRGEGGAACPESYGGLVVREDRLMLLRPIVLDADGVPDERTLSLLRSVVQALADRPRMIIEVGAHTDAEGSELENLAESQRRAERTRDLLVAAGASPLRVRARGYGEELPIESNSTAEGRAANRRLELRRVEAGSGGL